MKIILLQDVKTLGKKGDVVEYCAGKPINRMMKRSEESITPLTPTGFSPYHSYRFFANAQNDLLP